jgi:hypothetical protein
MVQEFIISTIETDLANKKIIVTTNNMIDPNSIDDMHIEVMERDSRVQVMFTREVKGNVLEITLTEFPLPNSSYIVYIKSMTNILGEKTRTGIRRKIEFKSSITKEVEIISPSMHEIVNDLVVKYTIKTIKEDDTTNPYVYIEVSNDNRFYSIAASTKVLDTTKDTISVSLTKPGQYFLRARLELNDKEFQYSKWSDVISFTLGYQEIETEKEDLPNNYLPEYDDMSPVIDIGPDYEITTDIIQGTTPKYILLTANKPLNEDSFNQNQIIIMDRKGAIRHHSIIDENTIEIELEDKLKHNSKYTLKLINIENIYGETFSADIVFNTQMKPMYCDLDAVTSLIGEYKIPDDVILYHIREASKFADYIASQEDILIDEDDIPFSVTQLVKYYAAHECLLRHTVDLSSSSGLKGTVGNVTFEERESTKDISKLLNHFCLEKDKWKDAMSGYGEEGRARMRTTVRGRYASPMLQPLGLNSMMTYGRGDLYGK